MEADLVSALTEALTADVEAVLADDTALVAADTAVVGEEFDARRDKHEREEVSIRLDNAGRSKTEQRRSSRLNEAEHWQVMCRTIDDAAVTSQNRGRNGRLKMHPSI